MSITTSTQSFCLWLVDDNREWLVLASRSRSCVQMSLPTTTMEDMSALEICNPTSHLQDRLRIWRQRWLSNSDPRIKLDSRYWFPLEERKNYKPRIGISSDGRCYANWLKATEHGWWKRIDREKENIICTNMSEVWCLVLSVPFGLVCMDGSKTRGSTAWQCI